MAQRFPAITGSSSLPVDNHGGSNALHYLAECSKPERVILTRKTHQSTDDDDDDTLRHK